MLNFNNIKIAVKIPAVIVGFAFIAAITIGTVIYQKSADRLMEELDSKLISIAANKKLALAEYLKSIENDIITQSNSPFIRSAITEFDLGWNQLPGNASEYLIKTYLTDSPYPIGERQILDQASDGSEYSKTHGKYHPFFHEIQVRHGYYDIFLFNLKGDLIYSVYKESDFSTNFVTGPYKKSGLNKAFTAALNSNKQVQFIDFTGYAPSNGDPAAFMSAPIYDPITRKKIGIIAYQMPRDIINKLMKSTIGLGETGQSYILGMDGYLRTHAPRSLNDTTLKIKDTHIDLSKVRINQGSILNRINYSGDQVVSVAQGIKFLGIHWVIIAEVTLQELQAPITSLRNLTIIIGMIVLSFLAGAAIIISKSITAPIIAITNVMNELSTGNLKVNISGVERGDEIGEMAQSVLIFKENSLERIKLEKENQKGIVAQRHAKDKARQMELDRERAKSSADAEKLSTQIKRQDGLNKQVNLFEINIKEILNTLNAASSSMKSTASSMVDNADQTSQNSTTVASASEEATVNMQTVASAADHLNNSIIEIKQQISETQNISTNAVSEAEKGKERVTELAASTDEIGQIVTLINDISEQTNLLALNATIEAARAGEAGKGFAVVASEVKNLATQTAKATEEIDKKIQNMQKITKETVTTISNISDVIGQINELSIAVSSAIELQSDATVEIANNVKEAATGTQEVSQSIIHVSKGAQETGVAADNVLHSSNELQQLSINLDENISKFISGIKAAQS